MPKGFGENITLVSKLLRLSWTNFYRPTSYPGKILFRAALASLFTLLSLARSLGRSSLGKNWGFMVLIVNNRICVAKKNLQAGQVKASASKLRLRQAKQMLCEQGVVTGM